MERQYVGIDLHRRSTTLYRMAENGEVLGCERVVGVSESRPTRGTP